MAKLFAWLHPKNDGLKIEAEEGTEICLHYDVNVPAGEIWLEDQNRTVIKKVKLKRSKSEDQKRGR